MERFEYDSVRLGAKLKTSELVDRLSKICQQLENYEQGGVLVDTLQDVARDLSLASMVGHSDRSVRVLVACCLAEILRLFAPVAPFDARTSKRIFDLFVQQLGNLGSASSADPYTAKTVKLLGCLAEVEIFRIAVDNPDLDYIIERVFSTALEVARYV